MLVLTAPIGLAAIAVTRTAALHRRIRTTGSTGVTRRQQQAFWLAMASLFATAGLATGELGSSHSSAAHAVECVLVAMVGIPALMASLPEWWVRQRLARWRAYRLARRLSAWPNVVVAAGAVGASHVPWVVELFPAGANGTTLLVAVWVLGSSLMWLPVLSPLPEHRATAHRPPVADATVQGRRAHPSATHDPTH